MSGPKNQSFARRLMFAVNGLAHALSSERSVRTQLVFLAGVLIALVVLHPAPIWWALVGLASAGVLGAELMNTALEHLADHLHPGESEQIRIVKDCAAGAVLLAAGGALWVAAALVVALWRAG